MLADGEAFGMSEASLANLRAALFAGSTIDEQDGVWPENWTAVLAFLAVSSQWRVTSIGGGGGGFAPVIPARPLFIGLDYSAAKVGLEAEGFVITPDLWRSLRCIEAEACAAINEAIS